MKVIGIDPGITATGYGIIAEGKCIGTGTIRPKQKEHYSKLKAICDAIKDLITEYQPDQAALEKVFYHKNVHSLIRASELRGAIILTLHTLNITITEYTPTQIKLTTTGNGRASKQQVRYMIERIFPKSNKKMSNHATDAIAIAYTAVRKRNARA